MMGAAMRATILPDDSRFPISTGLFLLLAL